MPAGQAVTRSDPAETRQLGPETAAAAAAVADSGSDFQGHFVRKEPFALRLQEPTAEAHPRLPLRTNPSRQEHRPGGAAARKRQTTRSRRWRAEALRLGMGQPRTGGPARCSRPWRQTASFRLVSSKSPRLCHPSVGSGLRSRGWRLQGGWCRYPCCPCGGAGCQRWARHTSHKAESVGSKRGALFADVYFPARGALFACFI